MTESTAIVKARTGASVLVATAERLGKDLQVLPLETPADREKATAILRAVEALIKRSEDEREGLVKPLNREVKAINGEYSGPRSKLQDVANQIRRRLAESKEKQEAAERLAAKIALERSRVAQAAETPEQARVAVETGNEALAAVPREQPPPPGVSFRMTWEMADYDIDAMPVGYIIRAPNRDAIKAHVKAAMAEGKDPAIPGVTFVRKATTVVR